MSRDFFGGPVAKNCVPMQEMWVQSLARELRSQLPQGNQGNEQRLEEDPAFATKLLWATIKT